MQAIPQRAVDDLVYSITLLTRLALASVLGPLGVHFCTFVRIYAVHFIVHLSTL